MKSPDDAHFQMWDSNPEPNKNYLDPRVVLDTGIDGQAWLYDTMNEGEANLVYKGETKALMR